MTKSTETTKRSRLTKALLETASDMRSGGLLDNGAHEKITMRLLGNEEPLAAKPISSDDIRAIRERAKMSQAVFARYLNVTVGYISQLERGAKRPSGAALALLNVIRRKGIEAIL
jgi:putative transcriptional regulator